MTVSYKWEIKTEDHTCADNHGCICSFQADLRGTDNLDGESHAVTVRIDVDKGTMEHGDPESPDFVPMEECTDVVKCGWLKIHLQNTRGPRGEGFPNMWAYYTNLIEEAIVRNRRQYAYEMSEEYTPPPKPVEDAPDQKFGRGTGRKQREVATEK